MADDKKNIPEVDTPSETVTPTTEIPAPGKDDPAPEHSSKVVDFAAARNEAEKTPKEKPGKQKAADKDKSEKPGRGHPPKEGKAKQPDKPRDKKSQSKPAVENPVLIKEETPVVTELPAEPAAPRDASRGEKDEIVYLDLSDLHPFKNHPFGVRDDAEMQGLVELSRSRPAV